MEASPDWHSRTSDRRTPDRCLEGVGPDKARQAYEKAQAEQRQALEQEAARQAAEQRAADDRFLVEYDEERHAADI